MGWIGWVGKSAAKVQGIQMQMQVQEQNQRSDEGRTGTSTIFIIHALLLSYPFALLTPLRLLVPFLVPCSAQTFASPKLL